MDSYTSLKYALTDVSSDRWYTLPSNKKEEVTKIAINYVKHITIMFNRCSFTQQITMFCELLNTILTISHVFCNNPKFPPAVFYALIYKTIEFYQYDDFKIRAKEYGLDNKDVLNRLNELVTYRIHTTEDIINRPTNDTCIVSYEPLTLYKLCKSNVPHAVSTSVYYVLEKKICPYCRSEYNQQTYHNKTHKQVRRSCRISKPVDRLLY